MPETKLLNSARKLTIALGVSLAISGAALAQEPAKDKVIAKVNGVEVTARELALAEVDMLEQFQRVPAEQRRAAILNALLDIKALAETAKEAGIAEDPNFKARMAFTRARTLHNSYFQEEVLKKITDEELKGRYEKEVVNFPKTQEVKARHILLEKEEEALAVIKSLDGGADFAELAKEKSTGPSGPNGGDLGYFGKGQMVPEFEAAVFDLEKGKYTKEPVKTQFGYHVILKEDERDREPPSFDQVKEQIRQAVSRERYFQASTTAREKYAVEILDEELKKKIDEIRSQ